MDITVSRKTHRLRIGLVYYVQLARIVHNLNIASAIKMYLDYFRIQDLENDVARCDYYRHIEISLKNEPDSLKWGFVFYVNIAAAMHNITIEQAIQNFKTTYNKCELDKEKYNYFLSVHQMAAQNGI